MPHTSKESAHEEPDVGFSYWVSDEQLEQFGRATPLQRLCWLEEMRTFTWNAASAETKTAWANARRR